MIALKRYTALDVFRGMTICFMIIVNSPGSRSFTFAPLLHAEWNGFTPTDLVYPSFLFAMGNALSFAKNKWQSMTADQVVWKILLRTLLIFAIGFILGWMAHLHYDQQGVIIFPGFSDARIFGVLQRIALVYGAAALMAYFLSVRSIVIISVGILLLYWPALLFFASPGQDPYSLTANAVRQIDLKILGEMHLYREGAIPFEPEGLLSTFPSIVNVVAGMLAGNYLKRKGGNYEVLFHIFFIGFLLIMAGCFWNPLMPVNKKLWTSSFVLLTTGLDCAILASIIYLIDFRKITDGSSFFQVFGKNPLFIYLLAEITEIIIGKIQVGNNSLHEYLYNQVFIHFGAYAGSLLFAVSMMLFCWSTGYLLDRNKIYIRV